MVTVDIEMKELMKKLNRVPLDMQDKVVKRAIRNGANVIARDAKKNAPVDIGNLKKSLKVKRGKYRQGYTLIVFSASKHHHLQELGTSDREPLKAKKLAFSGKNGNTIFVDKVKGVEPTPYLGNAYEKNKDAVVERFKKTVRDYVNKL